VDQGLAQGTSWALASSLALAWYQAKQLFFLRDGNRNGCAFVTRNTTLTPSPSPKRRGEREAKGGPILYNVQQRPAPLSLPSPRGRRAGDEGYRLAATHSISILLFTCFSVYPNLAILLRFVPLHSMSSQPIDHGLKVLLILL
jgi:hypothetical protein